MQSLLTLDVVRDAVAQQFTSAEEETALALRAPELRASARRTRTRLSHALHRTAH
jgi:hypothetical protein